MNKQNKLLTTLAMTILAITCMADTTTKTFSFDKETGDKSKLLRKEHRWVKGGDDVAGTLTLVAAKDHANGGKALKITKIENLKNFDRFRVLTPCFKAKYGTKQKVTGWFKADKIGTAQIQLTTNWEKNKTQWWKPINFQVNTEWKLYSFEFEVPDLTAKGKKYSEKFYVTCGLFQSSLNELYIKDLTWEFQE